MKIWLPAIIAFVLMTGCAKVADSKKDQAASAPTASPTSTALVSTEQPTATLTEQPLETSSSTFENVAAKTSLFGEIQAYDGKKQRTIEFKGESAEADWKHMSYSDFGIYVPDGVEIVKLSKEGEEIQYGPEVNTRLNIVYSLPGTDLKKEEDLSSYEEYIGSVIYKNETGKGTEQDDIRYDYFEISYGEIKGYVSFEYKKKDIEEARPVFIDITRSARYEDERTKEG